MAILGCYPRAWAGWSISEWLMLQINFFFVPNIFVLLCEIERSKEVSSFQESNPGPASALPPSYDNRTTTTFRNIYFQCEARRSKHLDWENHSAWVLSWWKEFSGQPLLMAQTEWLPGVWLRHFSTTCAVYREDCEGWWLSGCRSSVEHWLHKPGVLGSITSDCQPFYFPLL